MHLLRSITLATLAALASPAALAADCGKLLVSGYSSNVHVYDACSGAFQRVLDQATPRRLAGAQATRVHNGLLYVVSEETQKILRYRADNLDFVDAFIDADGMNPTGVAIGPDGDVYVGGYQSDSVTRFDGQSGAFEAVVVPARAAGLDGTDNGLGFGPDGQLYVPGYDSNNAVRYNPATGQTSGWVQAGAGGLRHTRAILFEPGGQTALIASEGSNAVLRFRVSDGGFVSAFINLPFRPTGLDYLPSGELLVTGDHANKVAVYNASSGAFIRDLVSVGSGGLIGPTFVTYLAPAATETVNAAHLGSQFWAVGAGLRSGARLDVPDALSANGSVFGTGFDPNAAVKRRWGALQITWTGCDAATLSWDSRGSDSAGFGTGGYPLQRIAPNPASLACAQQGFANVSDGSYMSGAWFGGPSRDGEGLFIDVLTANQVLVSFFTHRAATN